MAKSKVVPIDKREGEVKTPIFRCTWIELPNEDGKYTVTAVFDKDSDLSDLEDLMLKTAKAKFGKDIKLKKIATPLLKGNDRSTKGEDSNKHYEDRKYCYLTSGYAMPVVDAKGNEIDPEDSTELYSGAYFRAIINCYDYLNSGKKGVSFGLIALQKIKDGKKISGSGGMSKENARAAFNDGVAEKASKGGKKDKGKKDKGKKDKKKK